MEQFILSKEMIKQCFPKRTVDTHKGNYGKDLFLCGSVGFTGAAAMAVQGALRVGAGLVFLGVPQSIYEIEAVKLTEPVVFPLPEVDGKMSKDAIEEVMKRVDSMDVICIGSGMGISEGTEAVLDSLMKSFGKPMVLDADALTICSQKTDLLTERNATTILTPHAGEFRRLTGKTACEENAIAFAKDHNCIVVLKGHISVVTDGERVYRNTTGNPGMAVGGSGDVLAGIITSLLGQKVDPFMATVVGVWLHGAAGDKCAKEIGEYGMIPTDLIQMLPRIIKEI